MTTPTSNAAGENSTDEAPADERAAAESEGDAAGTTRRTVVKTAAAVGLGGAVFDTAAAASSWTVTGPDGGVEAVVTLDGGRLSLSVSRAGTTILGPSTLGLRTETADLASGLSVESKTDTTDTGSYTTTSGDRLAHAYEATLTTLRFTDGTGGALELDVRAAAEGVAYRYRIPGDSTVTVTDEASTFTVPGDPNAWVMPFSNDGVSTDPGDYYENDWRGTTAATTSGEYGWGTLFEVGQGNWLLLAEADVGRQYCTTRLTTAPGETTFSTALAEPSVTAEAPLESPWRVAVTGDLGTVTESDLITDLSPPSAMGDADWVEPGRAAWSWWSKGEVTSFERQRRYVDFAEKHGWEYVVVDYGWTDDDWVPELIDYAETVDIVLWADHVDLDSAAKRDQRFSTWREWGASGVKIDYFDDDSQSMMQQHLDILEAAASYDLCVNFHGVTVPKGWRRTWPNLLTMEAVQGAEYYKWDAVPVEHNAVVPYTRNVLGPMDYTPVTFSASDRGTTPAHELALAVVQESGQMHYADSIDEYATWPAAMRFLDTAAAAWETTHHLDGYPGDYAVVARQKPDSPLWHVGAITNGARTVEVDLSMLDDGTRYSYELTSGDGDSGLTVATGMVTAGDTLSQTLPQHGGLTILLYPEDNTPPSAPSNLTSPAQAASSIELSWDPASDADTEVDHYVISRDGTAADEWASTHARLTGLDPDTTYEVSVTAVDVAGNESEQSTTISVTTASGSGVADGTYRIENEHSGKALDVFEAATQDGADVVQWGYHGGANQQWRVEETGNGVYRIENVHSGNLLDMSRAGTENGDTVIQWSDTGGANQRWDIEETSDGVYRVVNVNSGKLLDVFENGTADGDTVVQWADNGGANQRWAFTEI